MLKIHRKGKQVEVTNDGKTVPGLNVTPIRTSEDGEYYEVWPENEAAAKILSDLPLTLFRIEERVATIRLAGERLASTPDWLTGIVAYRPPHSARFYVTAQLTFGPETPGMFEKAGAFASAISSISDLQILEMNLLPSAEMSARAQLGTQVHSLSAGMGRLATLLQPALNILARHSDDDLGVTISFDFPKPVRSACEQYLLHFGEFLRDLNVDAAVEVREVANQVLFSVTPADRDEALENIQTALDLYLGLTDAVVVGEPNDPDDRIMSYKLRANLNHLHSQLDLARAQNEVLREAVRAKDITIDLLQYRTLPAPADGAPSEALTKYVSVTDVQKAGVKVHLPELLRDLKNLFKRRPK